MDNPHYIKGQNKLNENRFEEAIELFTKAISEDDTQPFYFIDRAVAYLNLEKYELSMFDMNKAIELDDNYAYFYSCRGFLKARMKDGKGAVEDYERSLQLDPSNEITYNNLGLALESMGNMKRAQKMYEKGNAILGYDPEKRQLDESGQHMADKTSTIEQKKSEEESVDAPLDEKEVKAQRKKLAKEVFLKKSTFKEFLGFIGSGFKLKGKEDKTEND